jgi:amino acid transporter
LTATQIQGLIILNYDAYEPQRWHGTALMMAVLLIFVCINIWGMPLLPAIELIGGILHITLFIVIVVALVTLAPRSSPEFVFTGFINEGGWQSDGVSWCLGLLTVVYCFVGMAQTLCHGWWKPSLIVTTGFDGAIHLSEEIKDAPKTVPRVIILTIAINATLAFSFVIVLLFCIGDITTVLGTNTGYPIIALLWQATQSKAAASAMMAGIIIIAFSSGFALLASVSRLTFAFARDGGMPYSKFFATVSIGFNRQKENRS